MKSMTLFRGTAQNPPSGRSCTVVVRRRACRDRPPFAQDIGFVRIFFRCVLVLLVFAGMGCAGTAPTVEARLPELAAAAAAEPFDPDAVATYGVALHLVGDDESALPVLQKAVAADPRRFDSALVLGSIHLEKGDLDAAEQSVRSAEPIEPDEIVLLRSFRARIQLERARVRMQELARSEQAIPVDRIPARSLGVLDFTTEGAPEEMRGLGKAMTAVLTTRLASIPDLQVVESQELRALLEEILLVDAADPGQPDPATFDPVETVRGQQQRLATLNDRGSPFYLGEIDGVPGPATRAAIRVFQRSRGLAADGIAGAQTRAALETAIRERDPDADLPALIEYEVQPGPRAGRLLGARGILSGNIAVDPDEQLRVQSQLIDTIDGAILVDAQVDRPITEFHRVPGELVIRAAEGIGLTLEDRVRRELLDAPPVTSSLAAFLAFGRGLEYEDLGLWENAAAEYADALRLEPEFDLARQRAELVSFGSASFDQAIRKRITAAAATAPHSDRDDQLRSNRVLEGFQVQALDEFAESPLSDALFWRF